MPNQLKMSNIQSILTLRKQGWRLTRIASELGIHRQTVARYVREHSKSTEAPLGRDEPKPTQAPTGASDSKPTQSAYRVGDKKQARLPLDKSETLV